MIFEGGSSFQCVAMYDQMTKLMAGYDAFFTSNQLAVDHNILLLKKYGAIAFQSISRIGIRHNDLSMDSILSNEKYKGDALLQKRFTVDFLTKVMKKNEGEVPSYYVEDSHPAIIDPAEFDMVQAELARRKAVGRSYSGTGLFASKLYCADCGGVFGQKVWHSTDKYRRVVWQCNSKFKRGKSRCTTPILTEQGIQEMFLKAYAALLAGRQDIINDCEAAADMLTNVDSLNRSISAENERLEQNTELIRAVVREHASIAQSDEEYHSKYDPLMDEHEALSEKIEKLVADRDAKLERGKRLRSFLTALKQAPEELLEWDEQLWLLLVDHADIHFDGTIVFSFKNGTEIAVEK